MYPADVKSILAACEYRGKFGRGAISSLTGLLGSGEGEKENEKASKKKGRINLSKVSTNLSFPLQRSFFIPIISKEKKKEKKNPNPDSYQLFSIHAFLSLSLHLLLHIPKGIEKG